jgi:1-acyl-sn-glycerol-3-phosphate acyltransferase
LRPIVRFLLSLLAHVEYSGLESFPAPPYILVTNHLAVFDIPLLMVACPHLVRPMVADKHKRNLLYAALVSIARPVWVKRGEVDRQALRGSLSVLEHGGVLGIAPEGTRARGVYALQKGKAGVAYLAARANAQIVPVGLSGSEQIKRCVPRLRRARVRVAVGQPFRLPESGRVRGDRLDEYADLIMRRVAELLPAEYRGVYA